MLTRCLNRGVARLADGLVQMMKMFYTEEHVIKILGKDGTITFLSFSRDDIEDGTVINVKSGTPVMLDPIGRHNQAIQLWQLNAIDPETLFERLDFADPQAAAQKLFAWKNNQLVFESQLREKEALAGAEAKAKMDVEKNRDVENPNNVIQRAEKSAASAGGGAPLKNASNGTQGA